MQSCELSRRALLVRSAASAAGLSLSLSLLGRVPKARAAIDPPPNPAADVVHLKQLAAISSDVASTYESVAAIITNDARVPMMERESVNKLLLHFRQHHVQHRLAIDALIMENGGEVDPISGEVALPNGFAALTRPNTNDVIRLGTDKEKAAALAFADALQALSTPAAAKLVASILSTQTQQFSVLHALAERVLSVSSGTGPGVQELVPAGFVADAGVAETFNLENNEALDAMLELDPA